MQGYLNRLLTEAVSYYKVLVQRQNKDRHQPNGNADKFNYSKHSQPTIKRHRHSLPRHPGKVHLHKRT